jgi:MFS family permease
MPSTQLPPGARRLIALSVTARLPESMLEIGLLVHAQHVTGSFAVAGLVVAVYGLAVGVGGPALGWLVDRRGPTLVLVLSASIQAALLGATAVAPASSSVVVPLLLALGIGLATPPVGACLRGQLPSLVSDPRALNRAYALETSIVELTWVAGPPLVLGLGALLSTGGALAGAGVIAFVSTLAFAAQPMSRAWTPVVDPAGRRGGALRTPAMRTLTIAVLALGVALGADEVAVIAGAKALSGSSAAAAPLLALWAVGSFVGGMLVSRFGRQSASFSSLIAGLVAVVVGNVALIAAVGSFGALAGALLVAGAAIAPTEAAAYALVEGAAPVGTITEAFAWLYTALAVGSAGGTAAAGALIAHSGTAAAFALGAGACVLASAMTALRTRSPSGRPESLRIQQLEPRRETT